MTREVKAWWETTADYFQDDIDLDVGVNWTGFGKFDLDLLGDVAGDEILELGCGGGQCTVALAERGAAVTGIDISTIDEQTPVDADLRRAETLITCRKAPLGALRSTADRRSSRLSPPRFECGSACVPWR